MFGTLVCNIGPSSPYLFTISKFTIFMLSQAGYIGRKSTPPMRCLIVLRQFTALRLQGGFFVQASKEWTGAADGLMAGTDIVISTILSVMLYRSRTEYAR
jgi:hypothetical protein